MKIEDSPCNGIQNGTKNITFLMSSDTLSKNYYLWDVFLGDDCTLGIIPKDARIESSCNGIKYKLWIKSVGRRSSVKLRPEDYEKIKENETSKGKWKHQWKLRPVPPKTRFCTGRIEKGNYLAMISKDSNVTV